ncbi:hypothetical protein E1289_25265 [Actinomadura sp. 6K520]|nr:hypothetical protein E1289_25265 [Actinomadura sp. 6K520]
MPRTKGDGAGTRPVLVRRRPGRPLGAGRLRLPRCGTVEEPSDGRLAIGRGRLVGAGPGVGGSGEVGGVGRVGGFGSIGGFGSVGGRGGVAP